MITRIIVQRKRFKRFRKVEWQTIIATVSRLPVSPSLRDSIGSFALPGSPRVSAMDIASLDEPLRQWVAFAECSARIRDSFLERK